MLSSVRTICITEDQTRTINDLSSKINHNGETTLGGSGTVIEILDEQIAKAKEILGMNHHENIGFACTDSHFNDDIACDRSPYIESLPSAKLDFRTGGSGTAIAISDEQVSKATMLRGAKQEDYDETHAEDVLRGIRPHQLHHILLLCLACSVEEEEPR